MGGFLERETAHWRCSVGVLENKQKRGGTQRKDLKRSFRFPHFHIFTVNTCRYLVTLKLQGIVEWVHTLPFSLDGFDLPLTCVVTDELACYMDYDYRLRFALSFWRRYYIIING